MIHYNIIHTIVFGMRHKFILCDSFKVLKVPAVKCDLLVFKISPCDDALS